MILEPHHFSLDFGGGKAKNFHVYFRSVSASGRRGSMSWIEDRLRERRERERKNQIIAKGCEPLFNDLWDEIVTLCREAESKGIRVTTNGSPFEREVWISDSLLAGGGAPTKRGVKILLDKKNKTITARRDQKEVGFSIDTRTDGVLCLKYDSKEVGIQKAAEMILDPFFFPELPMKEF